MTSCITNFISLHLLVSHRPKLSSTILWLVFLLNFQTTSNSETLIIGTLKNIQVTVRLRVCRYLRTEQAVESY